MKYCRVVALAILGILVMIFFSGVFLMLSSGKTGGMAYSLPGRRGCFNTYEDACNIVKCNDWDRARPVDPGPLWSRPGFVACECPTKPNHPYKYVKMCA